MATQDFVNYYPHGVSHCKVRMHLELEPSDKLNFDFAGTKQHYDDSLTGELREAEVFIASLGIAITLT